MPSAKNIVSAGLLCALALLRPLPAEAYAPAVMIGLEGQGIAYSSEGGSPQSGAGLGLSGLLSWRGPWGEGGYVSASASTALDWLLADSAGAAGLYDRQLLLLEARLPSPLRLLHLTAGLEGSLAGTLEGDLPYIRPDWSLACLLGDDGKGRELELAARGYYRAESDGEDDSLYQGLRLDLSITPSIRARYGLLLEAGWELWPEIQRVDVGGVPTGEARNDLVGSLEASIGGLAGYFFDWSLAADLGGRWSNANRWLSALPALEEHSEDRVYAGLRGSADFSPHRQLSVQLDGFAHQELYLARDALDGTGTPTGEPLRAFAVGADLRADWSLGERLFFVLEASAGWRTANETAEERWNLQGGAGVQLRL